MSETTSACRVCKFPIQQHVESDYVYEPTCSNFCAQTSPEEKLKFLALKEGEYGVFPCAESGCCTEGEYTIGECCFTCSDKRKVRVRGELLQKAIPILRDVLDRAGPAEANRADDLLQEIKAALGIKADYVDCAQVGRTTSGRIAAYDFGW